MNAVGSLFPSKYQGFHYKLTDIRGSGAFGTVYGATLIHPNGQQSGGYCIKIVQSAYAKVESDDKVSCLTPNQLVRKTVEQIDREIFAMKKASRCNGTNQFIEAFNQHPNTQWGPLNICIVQKDCGRSTLKSLVGRPTVFENIVHIMGQILLITKDIHKQRIVHRDIKPENIMIDNNQIRIVDFGIAKEIDKDNNVLGQTQVGTPFYMAPEVLWGWKHRKNADTWSIGCLFYELLTGKVPFSANTIPQLQSDLYYNHLDWNQFKADVRKNFSDNNIAIGEDQIEAMRIFLSILLNKNSKERPGMTRCIGYFNQLCSHLGINHQI
ncbi:MAG: serine/threonine-protein kinase [Oscillospiraceae bacterium]|jgi:serine/threonine protein kinase|nr:serine/threonine-protein kinase [Oscillospiraceae bacterium]